MIRVGVVGLGKMGLSHHAILGAHPGVSVAGVCDSSSYLLDVLSKYTGVQTYDRFEAMLSEAELDAVVIATPSRSHAAMVHSALCAGLHVFCEKPFTLSPRDARSLAEFARERCLVTQVGYHNRFVGAFAEVKRLLDAGAIGRVTHALGEAYGPVVLKPAGRTWRSRRTEGGGCLYDYAAHVIDLLSWYLGEPQRAGGTVLRPVFSREIDDEVSGTLYFSEGHTAQISVNWSDESQRKMSTRITIWGTTGRIYVDRQECQVYLRDTAALPTGYGCGWNVRYTTALTSPVGFYLRGEEYSAQIDSFVHRIETRQPDGLNGFHSAAVTDNVIAMMLADAKDGHAAPREHASSPGARAGRQRWLRSWRAAKVPGAA